MKNLNKILIAFISVLAISCSGDDVENRPEITKGTTPVLLTPKSDLVLLLDKTKEVDMATSVVWEKATYDGAPTVINYSIEIAEAGTNFAKPSVAGVSTSTFKNFTVGELNAAVLDAGFKPFIENSIDVRVKSTVGGVGTSPQVSNSYTIKVTPYPAWPNWGIIGSATITGWDSDTNLDYDLTTKKYSITMNMVVGEFKFRLDDAWKDDFGDNGNNLILDAGGANIPITVAGSYTIVVDFTAKTYTIKKN
jgi:starch-binding outer membrane protein SusE/F